MAPSLRHLARLMATAATAVTVSSRAPELQLIGEERLPKDVDLYARRVQTEALRVLGSDLTEWDYFGEGLQGLRVYTRPVTGSNIDAVRSEAKVPLSAAALFQLFSSDEGFAIIDPNSAGSQKIRDLPWRERAEEVLSYTPLPWPASKRSTLAASFFDQEKRLVVTKSILDDDYKPGDDGFVRAFNTFALLVEPWGEEDEGASRLAVFDNVDLRGTFSAYFTNHFLKSTFCQDLQKRLYQHIQAKAPAAAKPAAQ